MFSILSHRQFRTLFCAQIIALLGTGLLTVALGLAAFDLAADQAGRVLGTALTIKMIAYVVFSPLANALFGRLPRKSVLVAADLVRLLAALALPFISSEWQIYGLILILQMASATFTPTFQSIIPDLLEDEEAYTKALSLSRFAYDLENLLSPAVAGILLLVVSFHWLFAGTAAGFFVSAILVYTAIVPNRQDQKERKFLERLLRGSKIYMATPRLRGLLWLNLCITTVGSMVIVNSVVIVRSVYQGSESDLAIALAAFGAGSMVAALATSYLLQTIQDRTLMLTTAVIVPVWLFFLGGWVHYFNWPDWYAFLVFWFAAGLCFSFVLTPAGRLLRRSAHSEDRPTLFAAQFALSHACWLLAYPAAGYFAVTLGFAETFLVFGIVAAFSFIAALKSWPINTREPITHVHDDLPDDHPHLKKHGGRKHKHVLLIDDEHHVWPTNG